MKYHSFLLSLAVLLLAVGCSNKMPLTGTVTFSDDGAPLTQGVIFFQSDKVLAQGDIGADGKYAVGTDKMTDGLPRGTYQVYITGTERLSLVEIDRGAMGGTARTTESPVIDGKYSRAETSGLSFTVDGKTRTFDIQVERYSRR